MIGAILGIGRAVITGVRFALRVLRFITRIVYSVARVYARIGVRLHHAVSKFSKYRRQAKAWGSNKGPVGIKLEIDMSDAERVFYETGLLWDGSWAHTGDFMGYIADKIATELRHYPEPPPSGFPQTFKTEKQRRWVMMAMREGLIQVPYQRTGTMSNSWFAGGAREDWFVGNSTPYAPLVVGATNQSFYHKPTWWTYDEAVNRIMRNNYSGWAEDFLRSHGFSK